MSMDAFDVIKRIPASGPGFFLTRRDLFAAMAMQGLISSPEYILLMAKVFPDPNDAAQATAEGAVKHADALIAELEKK